MRGRAHDPEVKAQVMAALLAGQSVTEVARVYKLSPNTVTDWRNGISEGEFVEVRSKKEDEFGTLLATYLREVLTTLSVQARHFRDTSWLKTQDASSLAVLHGVQTDKAIRLLEALEQAGGGE